MGKVVKAVVGVCVGLALLAGRAEAAVAEFFWAGFYVADAALDRAAAEKLLYENFDTPLRSARSGALKALLERVKWDEFAYHESAAERGHVHENLNDLYGAFISIDKVLRFAPDSLEVAGTRKTYHHTYVFATFNVFAADTRALVFSHPFFMTQTSDKPAAPLEVIRATLGQLPDSLRDPTNGFGVRIAAGLQAFFGGPGVSKEAIRRTRNPIHPVDAAAESTFGVNTPCKDCVEVADPAGKTTVNTKSMADFARFYLNAQLARFRPVAFQPEQRAIVQERVGDAAATAKEGDIERKFDEVCVPRYDKTGRGEVCVRVPPPRNPIWIGVRTMVKPRTGEGRLEELRYMTVVDLEAEIAGRKAPFTGELTSVYDVGVAPGQKVSDVYYINGIVKAVERLERDTIR